ncbi:MAG: KEOPS complex subunit Pcc1 [Halobacteriales archaeon]
MRVATIRTAHADAATVAAAVRPDNTPDMDTRVDDGTVVTTIERESTTGLQSTVDDYVVNVGVADAIAEHARAYDIETGTDGTANGSTTNSETTDTNPRTNTNTQ